VTGVPVARREAKAGRRHRCLAAWLAALLMVTPFARLSLPVVPVPGPAHSDFSLLDGNDAVPPAPRVRPAAPFDLALLVRWSELEIKPALSPMPPATGLQQAAGRRLAGGRAVGTQRGGPCELFQPSSVGTARRPTGPPAPALAFT
jgi:hypothetical protein